MQLKLQLIILQLIISNGNPSVVRLVVLLLSARQYEREKERERKKFRIKVRKNNEITYNQSCHNFSSFVYI